MFWVVMRDAYRHAPESLSAPRYVVCYCAGRCGQAAQWVNVSTITVQSAAWVADAEAVASAAFEAEFTASTFTDRPTDTDEPSTVTAVVSGPTDDECVADGGMVPSAQSARGYLQATQIGKATVAYPAIKRLLIHIFAL